IPQSPSAFDSVLLLFIHSGFRFLFLSKQSFPFFWYFIPNKLSQSFSLYSATQLSLTRAQTLSASPTSAGVPAPVVPVIPSPLQNFKPGANFGTQLTFPESIHVQSLKSVFSQSLNPVCRTQSFHLFTRHVAVLKAPPVSVALGLFMSADCMHTSCLKSAHGSTKASPS